MAPEETSTTSLPGRDAGRRGRRPAASSRLRRRALPSRRSARTEPTLTTRAARGRDRLARSPAARRCLGGVVVRRVVLAASSTRARAAARLAPSRSRGPDAGAASPAGRRCHGGRDDCPAPRCRRSAPSRSVTSPMVTAAPGSAPASASSLLDAEPGEPVGEVADGLVVAEVGLADPALGLRRRGRRSRPASCGSALDGEAGVVDGPGVQHDPRRRRGRPGGAVGGDGLGEGEAELAQPAAWPPRRSRRRASPRASSSGRTRSASSGPRGRRPC